ncbi:hypothetical protein H6F90_29735 [Trichocoleus sp. FACHB-591]|uniref:hypothetical protein n=1 Tax=Trichocoleus sp. FACHB-591 TaxID=2692872 RepID=UPI00168921AC|nr:hypothetical protein [Trichocoleus sp. FACHB-591]MBD2099248.1 hypothetical protein [Trichocoleus sp. FACHB-591]
MTLKELVRQKLALGNFNCFLSVDLSLNSVTISCRSMEDGDRLTESPFLDSMVKGANELEFETININCGREMIQSLPVKMLSDYDKSAPLFDHFFFKMVGSIKEPQKIKIEVKGNNVVVRLWPDEEDVADRIWRDYYGAFWLAGYYLETWSGDRQYASSRCCFKSRRTQSTEEA